MANKKVKLQVLASITQGMIVDTRLASVPFLSIYGKEAEIGHATRKYPMSAAHINVAASSMGMRMPKTTQLSMAAFMLQCATDNTLKAVMGPNNEFAKALKSAATKNDVFMEFKGPTGKTVACRAYMEIGQVIHLSYRKMPVDDASILIPAAVLATAVNENCMKLYKDFMDQMRIGTVYQFCDTVLYEFLMACCETAEITDDLSMEMMGQAISCGYYGGFPSLGSPLEAKAAPKRGQKKEPAGPEEAAGTL